MTLDVTIQLSIGRFAAQLDENDTVKAMKKKLRTALPVISHVSLAGFHILLPSGEYITDESKTVATSGITPNSVLFFIKKSACPAAAVDTERKTEE
jgi:hypothetical protein